jgi:hypothetical protein
VHAAVAIGVGLATAGVVLLLLFPGARWPLALAIGLLIATAIATERDAPILAGALGLAGAGACVWVVTRMVMVPASTWSTVALTALLTTSLTWAVARWCWARQRRRAGFERLSRIHHEVARFNDLVAAVDVADRLCALCPSASARNRAAELQALSDTRRELVRALEIERVLREHGAVLDAIDATADFALTPIEAAHATEQAIEQAALVEQSIYVAASVRAEVEEMRQTERRPHVRIK